MVELSDQERQLLVALIMNASAPLKEHALWMALASKLEVAPTVTESPKETEETEPAPVE